MQITHEEAHRLIQFNADGELKAQQKNMLASHLDSCSECQRYADSIAGVESILRPMLQRQWKHEHLPLSIGALRSTERSSAERIILATRIAAFAVVFIGFFFGAWNFTVSSKRTPTPYLPNVPAIPTPFTSTMTAGTESSFENCVMTSYIVQQGDTLASIAYRFSAPVDTILQMNGRYNETINTGETLIVPSCNFTPTNPAMSHTTTFTPVLYSTTTTPDV